jgi:putative (di)nucleoside polyphosphate hydrolase
MTIDISQLGYRPCVGAMILNRDGLIWIGRRFDAPNDVEGRGTWWQMPQGGIDEGEDAAEAVLREVLEETGIRSVEIITELPGFHHYDLPQEMLARKVWGGKYRGQKQKWFALRFTGDDGEVTIDTGHNGVPAEFDTWRWAKASELPSVIVPFKQQVYSAVLADAAKLGLV